MNYNKLILLVGSLLTQPSIADTDVYLTNNSDKPSSIQVQHRGTTELSYSEEWQQKLGILIFESDESLASRIAQFKQQAKLVWGAWAEVLLTAYDFKLDQQNLLLGSPEQYRDAFEALLESSHEHDLGLNTDVAKFEKAVSSLPDTMSEDEKNAFIAELEHTYLTHAQKQDIRTRERQVTAQQDMVQNYHFELSQLKNRLSNQRNTKYAELTDTEWQMVYRRKITEFRRTFFSHEDDI
ncbi:hypothetical protein [Vibrio sp. 10N]|uniref:hypothetical protein n=1 Tax=Vibrio sp. 10N TaxID=3058938 RepID=UPI002813C829|nr:hypothetical protein VB10N_44150 [Vibrio sp. 10N]